MRVALADADQVLRDGLRSIFSGIEGMEVVGSYPDARTLLDALTGCRPDIIVMEAHLPDGTGAAWVPAIKAQAPNAKILILTSSRTDADLLFSLEAGVDGYVSKEGSAGDLLRAIREACQEHFYVSPLAGRQLRDLTVSTGDGGLTQREIEVLVASQEGLTTEEIGERLLLSVSTVKTHLGNLYRKLDAHNRTEAIHEGMKRGIIGQ